MPRTAYEGPFLPFGPVTRFIDGNVNTILDRAARQTYNRAKSAGRLSPVQADRLAVALGLHPADVWGQAWWDAA